MKTFAVIDIGSNTIRLVIYELSTYRSFKEIENVKIAARLRNYLSNDGYFSTEGMTQLVETLSIFKEIIHNHQVDELKVIATATIRQAKNQQKIIDTVINETGFTIQVLTEYEEAYYGYLSVVNSTSIQNGIAIDIGGGSTEITLFQDRKFIQYHSFPFGALSLANDFIEGQVSTKEEIHQLKTFITNELTKHDWLRSTFVPIVGIGGSARNMVQIDQAIKSYPIASVHQYELTQQDISHMIDYLSSLSFDSLQKVEGLSKDRADTIVPALIVFLVLMEISNAPSFILSRKGLREGLMYDQLTKTFDPPLLPNVVEESFFELANDFQIDIKHAVYTTNLCTKMFYFLQPYIPFSLTDDDLLLLRRASYTFHLGEYIDSESSSQHTFYVLANRTINGLSHKEKIELALLSSYKSNRIFKQYVTPFKNWFSKEELKKIRFLGSLLKFTYSFNYTKRQIVKDISVTRGNDGLHVNVYCQKNWIGEYEQIEKQKKHLEKNLKTTIILTFTKEHT
jgi:exopolyphosphatase / guanosine-5'-triphosphate,3'-diphosphate pyrophosphatase